MKGNGSKSDSSFDPFEKYELQDLVETETARIGENENVSPWIPGKLLLGHYKIVDILGQGGMGCVYLVERHITQGKIYCAVKTLLTGNLDNDEKQRAFIRELRTWMDLPAHPNLNACYFFRTVEDRLAIFAEYINGGSLKQWIKQKKIKQLPQIIDIAIQFAWGLHAA
ncbi:protein kinase, partial [bacterium]|nr:protein kinase [candidate division CSSED10-310 bacterium]